MKTTFGLPDSLPPLDRHAVRTCLVFAGMGLLVLLLGLFPALRPPPRAALPIALALLAIPAWGLIRFLKDRPSSTGQRHPQNEHGTRAQVGFFAILMVTVGIVLFLWTRHLGVPPTVALGLLLVVEGLAGTIVSLTEWWRLSHLGLSAGLMTGGFLLPLANGLSPGVPVGGAVLLGSLVSAGILVWQIQRREPTRASGC